MTNYDFVLFDVDDTLIDFALAEKQSIERVFKKHHVPFNDEIYTTYRNINIGLWEAFELGNIGKEDLLVLRFERLFEKYGLRGDISAINLDYQIGLGTNVSLKPYAIEICKEVDEHCTLAIVTNGTVVAQRNKLKNSGLDKIFSHIFISDELQYSKPDSRFFEHVFSEIKAVDRDRILIIGDSLGSDIKGGNNSGIHTCWYNPQGIECTQDVEINYEIKDLFELRSIILNR